MYGQTDEKDRFQAVISWYEREGHGKFMAPFYVTVSITGIKWVRKPNKWQEAMFTGIAEAFLTSLTILKWWWKDQVAYSELCSRKFFLKAPMDNATTLNKLAHTSIPVFRRLRWEVCKFRDNRSQKLRITVNQKTIASLPWLATCWVLV